LDVVLRNNVTVLNVFASTHTPEAVMHRTVHWLALLLVIVGAVNWGLVGIAQFDLVAALLGGADSALSRVVYSLVGVAGLALTATSLAGIRSHESGLRPSRA
jgi:uncharacterized membrane protein YuzA (DUF378 family)